MPKPLCNRFYAFSAFCIALGWCNLAQAAAIANLTDGPLTVELKEGENYTPLTIEAGRTWRVVRPVTVRYHASDYRIGVVEEYAAWPDGDFGPQRPNARSGLNF